MLIFLSVLGGVANALTLEETVARAAEVSPSAVIAELEWRQARLDAAEKWSGMTITPEITVERSWVASTVVEDGALKARVGLLDVPAWFGALDASSEARAARWGATATALDAQYAAALLYFEIVAADGAVQSARLTAEEAQRTLTAARARATAGLDDELMAQTAEVHALETAAELARAEADRRNARARLSRALEQDIGEIASAALPALPGETSASPWLDAYDARAASARYEELGAWSELLPSAELQADAKLGGDDWRVTLQGRWTIDGVGPFLRARRAALEKQAVAVARDGLQRDLDLGIATAVEDAQASALVAQAARARVALAEKALGVGQARLSVGLIDTLDLLQLQRDVRKAREDVVEAGLAEAVAVLEARRVAGVAW
jgi:outer membrane protein TolC